MRTTFIILPPIPTTNNTRAKITDHMFKNEIIIIILFLRLALSV
jgi:hypothetical protein